MTQLNFPYLRKAKVLIGPLKEWEGGGNQDTSKVIYGDGGQIGFRIKFNVQKFVFGTATPTVIQVYNLNQDFKKALQVPGIQVSLYVGWQNTNFVLLHTGSLLGAYSQRHGSDIVTDLLSNPAFGGSSRTIISDTFTGGMSVKEIVFCLAYRIPGITIDIKNITIDPDLKVGSQGYSDHALINDYLDRLARIYGFSWRVENKVFYALQDREPLSEEPILIKGGSSNLIRVEPMLSGPTQQEVAVSITSTLNPYIKPGSTITIDSYLNPNLNRDYTVHTLSHYGDTHGPQWETHIESYIIVG